MEAQETVIVGDSWEQREDSRGITEGFIIETGEESAFFYIPNLEGRVLKKGEGNQCYEKLGRGSVG